ncbi:hypothetical protein GCM10027052_26740 [Parafrigoribacterium mesophilum]
MPSVPLPSVAPALAVASNAWLVSVPTGFTVALRASECATSFAPTPMPASFSSFTLFTASPAPMPTEVAPVDVPSAVAVASVLLCVVNDAAPLVVRVVAGASSAVVVDSTRLKAIAAATVTSVPSSFSAAGVLESFAPAEERAPASDSLASDFWLALWPVESLLSSGAPAALASALVDVVETPSAVMPTSPAEVTSR